MMKSGWFEVDKNGLAKLLNRSSLVFVVLELLQNSWDEDVKNVKVTLTPVPNTMECLLVVEDDSPDGFVDLQDSWVLYAESKKKIDPTKRGRFNVGEKRVLALCKSATIETTTGTVVFSADGTRRQYPSRRRAVGTVFTAHIRATREQLAEIELEVRQVIPPAGIATTFNGELLQPRAWKAQFSLSLPTEIADAEGVLKRRVRQTSVTVYEPLPGETPRLYEMGIPVVETGDTWHVDIGQKIPLNTDRDNVTPAYLRAVRVGVLNAMHAALTKEEVTKTWVKEASSDERIETEAVAKVMDLRFGEKRVAFDPTDREANNIAVSRGYTVVPGGAMSKDEWRQAKKAEAVKPAGQVTPSPKPFSPDGSPLKMIERDQWTPAMRWFKEYVVTLGRRLLNREVTLQIANDPGWGFGATYGNGKLIVNAAGKAPTWFDFPTAAMNELLIHEFAHDKVSNHLSAAFYDECCRLGSRMVEIALDDPQLFRRSNGASA